jgi:hypothetical protein
MALFLVASGLVLEMSGVTEASRRETLTQAGG